eukprot:1804532-Rhodomonas_salina.4
MRWLAMWAPAPRDRTDVPDSHAVISLAVMPVRSADDRSLDPRIEPSTFISMSTVAAMLVTAEALSCTASNVTPCVIEETPFPIDIDSMMLDRTPLATPLAQRADVADLHTVASHADPTKRPLPDASNGAKETPCTDKQTEPVVARFGFEVEDMTCRSAVQTSVRLCTRSPPVTTM